jgi:hypothetical protein
MLPQDKSELVHDFIYLLKTGPGYVYENLSISTAKDDDNEVDCVPVTIDIRLLAIQSLIAIVTTKDNIFASGTLYSKFTFLQVLFISDMTI